MAEVLETVKRGAAATALTLGGGALIGSVIGGVGDILNDDSTGHGVELARSDYELSRQAYDLAVTAGDELAARYGAVCIQTVMPYTRGGPLEDYSVEQVRSNLLEEPGAPCTDSPTTVDVAVKEIRNQENLLHTATKSFEENKKNLSTEIENKDKDNQYNTALVYGRGGLIAGTVMDFFIGVIAFSERRRRYRV
jgi:galactokinase/mevalonate kinase-like predicted kinase